MSASRALAGGPLAARLRDSLGLAGWLLPAAGGAALLYLLWTQSVYLVAALVVALFYGLAYLYLTARQFAISTLFLLAFVNLLNYSPIGWFSSGATVGMARLPLLLVGLMVLLVRYGAQVGRILHRNWDVALFLSWCVASGLLSQWPARGVGYALWLGLAILFILLLFHCFDTPAELVHTVSKTLVLSFLFPVVLGAWAIPNYLSGRGFIEGIPRRLDAALDIEGMHAWAAVVVIGAVVVLGLLARTHRLRTVLATLPVAGPIVVVSLVGLILSGTKAAVAGLAAMLVVFVLSGVPGAATALRFGPLLVAGVWLAQRFVYSDTLGRYSKLFVEGELTYSDQLRVRLWKANWEYGLQHPLFGGGLVSSKDVAHTIDSGLQEGFAAHSTYVGIVSELGLVGAALFLLLLLRSAVLLRRNPALAGMRALPLLLFVGPGVISIFQSNLTPGQALFVPFMLAILLPRWMPAEADARRYPAPLRARPAGAPLAPRDGLRA
jgi:O-antigen ligase